MRLSAEQASTAALPPPPTQHILSAEQWGILSAIADTVTPAFTPSHGNRLLQHPLQADVYSSAVKRIEGLVGSETSNGLVSAYLGESATAQPEFKEHIYRLVAEYMTEGARNGLLFILTALNTRAGCLLLTGYATSLDRLSVQDREKIILAWATSRIPLLRGLNRAFTTLCQVYWLRTSPTLGGVIAYPNIHSDAVPPGAAFPYRFIQVPPATSADPEVIETDVVIVGSGCGGAVAAKTLAEAGLRVLVVDKGYYWPPEFLPMPDATASIHLFGNGGAHVSTDSSITVVPGSTWGGGGTVNWSASLQPQGIVRREWANKFGLRHFCSSDFQADLDAVCERMGVSSNTINHNKGNQVLLEGARKLGWGAKAVAQNTGNEVHDDGFCTRGCRSCGKKGPTVTWLPDAANAGATFMEGLDVKEILFDETVTSGEKPAVGIRGVWTSRDQAGGVSGFGRNTRQVVIKASRTIISGGSLYTPILLQHSGLKNKHIGRHLHLHPVSMLAAVWDEDVLPWEGPILTSVVNEFENLDGEGYGAKLEATTMIPGIFLSFFEWKGGLEWKEFTAKMRRMTGYISLARDRYGGRIYPDPKDGRCTIQYTPSKHDQKHIHEGIIALAQIMYVEGAREIHSAIPGVPPFVRPASDPEAKVFVTENQAPSLTDADFQAWLEKLRSNGTPSPSTGFASAHQMGSCRMGTSPKNSVVDWRGRVWGTQGLYIADASVFPSASGVNPMITVMGIARGIARGIVDEVNRSTGATDAKAKL